MFAIHFPLDAEFVKLGLVELGEYLDSITFSQSKPIYMQSPWQHFT